MDDGKTSGGQRSSNGNIECSSKSTIMRTSNEAISPKPPDRKQHEQQLEQLQTYINQREEENEVLSHQVRAKKELLSKVRKDREVIYSDKQDIFNQLEQINKEVTKQSEHVQKLRSSVSYQTGEQIDGQIKRLEWQINKTTFKLPEERRIVAEIDRLKRNRQTLTKYSEDKEVLGKLRDEQKVARDNREHWFKSSREVKAREDELRSDVKKLSEQLDVCKKQMDEYKADRRTLVSEFRHQSNVYRKFKDAKIEELRLKLENDRQRIKNERAKEMQDLLANSEPYLKEKTLCSLLIHYCDKLAGGYSTPVTPASTPGTGGDGSKNNLLGLPQAGFRRRSSGFSTAGSNSSSRYGTPATTPLSGTPPTSMDDIPGFYKKKEEDSDIFFAGSRKKSGKKSKERRVSFKKVLTHTPETYQQFSSLDLNPPQTLLGVGEVQKQLKDKLDELEEKAVQIKVSRLNIAQNAGAGDHKTETDCPKIPEIYVLEDIDDVDSSLSINKDSLAYCRKSLSLNIPKISIPNIIVDVHNTPNDLENTQQTDQNILIEVTNNKKICDNIPQSEPIATNSNNLIKI